MRVRVLGSAAGGGVPQWNCRCSLCETARSAPQVVRARSHASIALSGDGERWVVCNAGPDIQRQIERFPALLPHDTTRGTSISAIALTGADLDQVLGLLLLREGAALRVYGTRRVREALTSGVSILPTLAAYSGIDWQDMQLAEARELCDKDGSALGLGCEAFAVAGGPPPYAGRRDEGQPGDTIGLIFTDERNGARLAYVPSCGAVTEELVDLLRGMDCVLFDGTLWRDDEIAELGIAGRTGRSMQHLPLSGPGGTLDRLRLSQGRRILIHINNTNPILIEGGPEQAEAAALGWELAYDGMELEL